MSDLPPAAIEAAARALYARHSADEPGVNIPALRAEATAVIRAAMPAIAEHLRETVAQEIEAQGREVVKWLDEHRSDAKDMGRLIGTEDAYKDAIRIAKGEKWEGPA